MVERQDLGVAEFFEDFTLLKSAAAGSSGGGTRHQQHKQWWKTCQANFHAWKAAVAQLGVNFRQRFRFWLNIHNIFGESRKTGSIHISVKKHSSFQKLFFQVYTVEKYFALSILH